MLISSPVCTTEKQFIDMTDSMKFGPEWLRNLSADGNSTATSTTRYHLAEHRYGREEMLALFEQSLKIRPPSSMMSFTSLYVDQALNPLALAPMTEDENRLWSGRTVAGGGIRGRGGSLERGRGRGRGGTFHPGFNRSTSSYDEPLRSYDRSQSDRGWPERNGDMTSDWGGSSPRKEYGTRGGNVAQDNWRRHRDNSADEDGWRSSQHMSREKWSGPGSGTGLRSSGNWRSESERTVDEREGNRGSGWHGPTDHGRTQPHRRPWDAEDHLPEWANEIPSESGGSFDASGAFHGSDEEVNDKQSRNRNREQPPLHKSASQHNITTSPKKPPPLATSQSAINLAKPTPSIEESPSEHPKNDVINEKISQTIKPPTPPPTQPETEPEKEKPPEKEKELENVQHKIETRHVEHIEHKKVNSRPVDDEFDHMKEVTDDIVAKLILDDDALPKRSDVGYGGLTLGGTTLPPPGNVGVDKWYYRDPQGETQGPFSAQEMTEWYRAGYFTVGLLVRRQCDERYFMLGELVKQCPGGVPFLSCRLPPLKTEPTIPLPKPSDQDAIIQHQINVQRILQRQAEAIRALSQTEPWSQLSNLQQRELISQHMMQQSNMIPDVPYVPQMQNSQLSNPIMHMISQMQQANKLPTQSPIVEKPPNTVPSNQLDPIQQLVQHMGRLPPNISPAVPTMPNIDQSSASDTNAPIKNLLRQLSTKVPTMDSMWPAAPPSYQPPLAPQPQQWPSQTLPTSLWDLHAVQQPVVPQPPPPTQPEITPPTPVVQEHTPQNTERVDKEAAKKAEAEQKEAKVRERKEQAEKEKKKKELEQQEKLKAQKEAEEKRKEEQRKKEAEKKAEAERQRREEERVRKELEKAKREAEEKRQRELEEKRRLKEQRKAEEEARRKQEEEKQKQDEEAARRKQEEERQRQKEEVGRRQQEALRKMQEQQRVSKVAPWASLPGTGVNTNSTTTQPASLSLAEIQRIEREKKAEQAAIVAQQQRALAAARETLEQQQQQQERQLGWAVKKPTPKKVKSLAEIQAEEQEKLQRQQAEQRLREQSTPAASVTATASAGIWGTASQNLTWASNQQQWQHASGFWDDSPIQQKPIFANKQPQQPQPQLQQPVKQQAVMKTNTPTTTAPTIKSKAKKEEQQMMKHFDKSASNDEFSAWCSKTLATLNGDVDIPTFISFLRDIESPYEVKDYVRQYLGDSAQAAHFANQFVERRSKARDRQRAANQHKDDLNTPAPAVNPASSDFQEVKGKGKKSKKSKMVKLDNRALGFNVIAAQDRINVGDRDYGDNL